MKKGIFLLLLISPLLLAFTCDDDYNGPSLRFNEYKVRVSPQANFSTGDTIWITGKISSRVFDESINDSIFYNDTRFEDHFSVMQLVNSTKRHNSIEALRKFKVISPINDVEFLNFCKSSDLYPFGTLSTDGNFYEYNVGLIPMRKGDYLIVWNKRSELSNSIINETILNNYVVEGKPGQINFTKCGRQSTILNIDDAFALYFFSVN